MKKIIHALLGIPTRTMELKAELKRLDAIIKQHEESELPFVQDRISIMPQ